MTVFNSNPGLDRSFSRGSLAVAKIRFMSHQSDITEALDSVQETETSIEMVGEDGSHYASRCRIL